MSGITVMLVDNNPDRIHAISAAVSSHNDFQIVASVSKRETALKQLALSPDIMLVNADLLSQRTLLKFLRAVQAKSPPTRVVLLHETLPDDETLMAEIKLGARGYIRTSDPPALLNRAIRAVAKGEIWAERRILEKTLTRHMVFPETLRSHIPDLQPLTSREMDMLNLVLQGATNKEIADMCNISERTVKTHLYRVYRKLKVKSRAKAIALLSHS